MFDPEASPYAIRKGDKVLYTPGSATYEEFHGDLTTPNILLFGRRGTRKSWSVRWHLHRLSLEIPGFQYMVCRLSKPELQRTHLQFLDDDMEALGGKYDRTDGETQYENGSVGIWAGFEKEKDALKVLGMTLDMLVIEEITTMSWSVVMDLATTLRASKNPDRVPQLIAPTNPFGPHAGAVKRRWITKDVTADEDPEYDPNDYRAILTSKEDNPYLDFKTYDKRLGGLQAAKRKAWLLGEWSSSEGSFFEDFKPERDGQPWHVIARLPEINGRSIYRNLAVPVYRTLDWGFSDDPCVCQWIAVLPNGRGIVINRKSWKRTPAAEVAREIIGHSRDMRIVQTFADPSMWNTKRFDRDVVAVADVFERNGVPLTPSVNDRRVYSIHERLTTEIDGAPSLQFWQEGCDELIRAIAEQTANKNDPERMADSRTDHDVMALSYFCSGGVNGHEDIKPPELPYWMRPKTGDRLVLGSESTKHRHVR
jgi:hypothetical protein